MTYRVLQVSLIACLMATACGCQRTANLEAEMKNVRGELTEIASRISKMEAEASQSRTELLSAKEEFSSQIAKAKSEIKSEAETEAARARADLQSVKEELGAKITKLESEIAVLKTSLQNAVSDQPEEEVEKIDIPSHAQTKDQFSIWTEPADVKAGEKFTIVIQVRLPKLVAEYNQSDLSGTLSGSDGYRQKISFKSSKPIPVEKGHVELRVPVVGGAAGTRNTIMVKSKILGKQATFEIAH